LKINRTVICICLIKKKKKTRADVARENVFSTLATLILAQKSDVDFLSTPIFNKNVKPTKKNCR
jgi:hypothetical protein